MEDVLPDVKPAPKAIVRALRKVTSARAESVFVDDDLATLIAARALGLRTVWVAGPKANEGQMPVGVDVRKEAPP